MVRVMETKSIKHKSALARFGILLLTMILAVVIAVGATDLKKSMFTKLNFAEEVL